MSQLVSIGTYLPPWTVGNKRVRGPDEDAVTMAVAAGRATAGHETAERIVLVTRDQPLLEGDNGAVLLAALSMGPDTPVTEVLGSGPAVLDQLVSVSARTLVIACDDSATVAGAAAALVEPGDAGTTLTTAGARTRSLPMIVRSADGAAQVYADPRLQRDVGVSQALSGLIRGDVAVVAIAGASAAAVEKLLPTTEDTRSEPAASSSSALRALAAAVDDSTSGVVVALEQSTATAVALQLDAPAPPVGRDEVDPKPLPEFVNATGTGIPISLAAYARAFEPKLRWEAAVFADRKDPVFPPRIHTDDSGQLITDYRLQPLPRTGTIYTQTTVRIPVPDLPSPYSLAVVQLDGSPVRVLMKVTGVPAGETAIGQSGSVVLRRVAVRSGIPDYGYSFWPTTATDGSTSTPQEAHS